MRAQIVIVAQASLALELALDSLDDLRRDVRLFLQPAEAAMTLLSPSGPGGTPPVGVVLVEVGDTSVGVEEFVVGLRQEPSTASVPIVLFGPKAACERLDLPQGFWPHSYVYTVPDPGVTGRALAQTIHYWGVVNRPEASPLKPQSAGDRA